jgi:hypothetical protein
MRSNQDMDMSMTLRLFSLMVVISDLKASANINIDTIVDSFIRTFIELGQSRIIA